MLGQHLYLYGSLSPWFRPPTACLCGAPFFPSGIRILQVSASLAEAAGNGLRHPVACLYHCNRQVGLGEWARVVLVPLSPALAG